MKRGWGQGWAEWEGWLGLVEYGQYWNIVLGILVVLSCGFKKWCGYVLW